MILECKISDFSPIIDKKVGEIEEEFKIKIVHLHEGLPPIYPDEPLRFRINPPVERIIPKGWYVKVNGNFEDVMKFAKTASSSQNQIL